VNYHLHLDALDPGSKYRNEVARVLKESWGISERELDRFFECKHLDPNGKSTFHTLYYVVLVQSVKDLEAYGRSGLHQRVKRFVDHLDSVNFICGSYVEPGVVTNDMI
jgi:uncharacterized protein YfbU (UPF0304 family)